MLLVINFKVQNQVSKVWKVWDQRSSPLYTHKGLRVHGWGMFVYTLETLFQILKRQLIIGCRYIRTMYNIWKLCRTLYGIVALRFDQCKKLLFDQNAVYDFRSTRAPPFVQYVSKFVFYIDGSQLKIKHCLGSYSHTNTVFKNGTDFWEQIIYGDVMMQSLEE